MNKGLYDKYIVLRRDGRPADGVFFALKPETDIHARVAMMAYAESCRIEKPQLSEHLVSWLKKLNA